MKLFASLCVALVFCISASAASKTKKKKTTAKRTVASAEVVKGGLTFSEVDLGQDKKCMSVSGAGAATAKINSAISSQCSSFAEMMTGGDASASLDTGITIGCVNSDIIQLTVGGSSYSEGAAHPNSGMQSFIINRATGDLVTNANAFFDDSKKDATGKNWKQALVDVVGRRLHRQDFDGNDRQTIENFVSSVLHWSFDESGLTLSSTDGYELGSYAQGPFDTKLSYQALAPYVSDSALKPLKASSGSRCNSQ